MKKVMLLTLLSLALNASSQEAPGDKPMTGHLSYRERVERGFGQPKWEPKFAGDRPEWVRQEEVDRRTSRMEITVRHAPVRRGPEMNRPEPRQRGPMMQRRFPSGNDQPFRFQQQARGPRQLQNRNGVSPRGPMQFGQNRSGVRQGRGGLQFRGGPNRSSFGRPAFEKPEVE